MTRRTQWLWLHLQSEEEQLKCNLLYRECNDWRGKRCSHRFLQCTVKLMWHCQETIKFKFIAVTRMVDTEATFCVHTSVCSVGLLNKICSPVCVCFNLFFFPTVDSAPFNNSHAQKNYKSRGEGRKQTCLNVFPFEGLMAEVLVTNRMECCAVRWLLQKQGNLEDRCVRAETQTHWVGLWCLPWLSPIYQASVCLYLFPLKELSTLK